MLSHRKLSNWYRQLAQQLEAGLPMANALRLSGGTGPSSAQLDAMAGRIEAGGSLDDALRSAETWLPLADLLALSAAAEAGRMPITLHRLSVRHQQLGAAKLKLLLACIYPLCVLHVGVLLLPVTRMIDWEKGFLWNGAAYARTLAFTLLPLWTVLVTVIVLARRESPGLRRVGQWIPLVRGYLKLQALADLAFTLANFLEAGVPIGRTWSVAALTTRSPQLKPAAESMAELCERGVAPGAHLVAWPVFPPDFAALYRSGEQVGQLDTNLHALATQLQDTANRALVRVAVIYPALLFLTVAGTTVYYVVMLMSRYFAMLTKLAQ